MYSFVLVVTVACEDAGGGGVEGYVWGSRGIILEFFQMFVLRLINRKILLNRKKIERKKKILVYGLLLVFLPLLQQGK